MRLTVQISLPVDLKFKAIKIKEALQAVPKIELVQKGSLLTVAQSPQQILEQQYLLSSYEAGTYQIPSITVDYEEGGFIKSASAIAGLQLKVNSIPVNPERDTLRAIKNINREEVRFSDFLMPILIVLILLGLVIFTILYLSRRRTRKHTAEPAW